MLSSLLYTNASSSSTPRLTTPRTASFQGESLEPAAQDLEADRPAGPQRLHTEDLAWVFNNPYNSVRGRHARRSSASAVRSLLALVPAAVEDENENSNIQDDDENNNLLQSISEGTEMPNKTDERQRQVHRQPSLASSYEPRPRPPVSAPETASQLAEGSIRALRDLALDEAVELQEALRYWNARWERPLWSWLEAGPWSTSCCSAPVCVYHARELQNE